MVVCGFDPPDRYTADLAVGLRLSPCRLPTQQSVPSPPPPRSLPPTPCSAPFRCNSNCLGSSSRAASRTCHRRFWSLPLWRRTGASSVSMHTEYGWKGRAKRCGRSISASPSRRIALAITSSSDLRRSSAIAARNWPHQPSTQHWGRLNCAKWSLRLAVCPWGWLYVRCVCGSTDWMSLISQL